MLPDIGELLKWIGKGARVCMEATGVYHLQLALTLVAAGVEVMVDQSSGGEGLRRALSNRSKTDRGRCGDPARVRVSG